jgi:hypothetical protein
LEDPAERIAVILGQDHARSVLIAARAPGVAVAWEGITNGTVPEIVAVATQLGRRDHAPRKIVGVAPAACTDHRLRTRIGVARCVRKILAAGKQAVELGAEEARTIETACRQLRIDGTWVWIAVRSFSQELAAAGCLHSDEAAVADAAGSFENRTRIRIAIGAFTQPGAAQSSAPILRLDETAPGRRATGTDRGDRTRIR